MIKRIPIRYDKSASILIGVNPVVKLIWLFLLSFILLWINDYRIVFSFLIFILFVFFLSRIRILKLQGSRFAILTSVVIGLFHLFFNREGNIIINFGLIEITQAGYENAMLVSSRFLAFILAGYLFVLTTEPNTFVYSLMQLGMPYRFGFALITALRLIPIFTNEVITIFHAQVTRGVVYSFSQPGKLFGNVFQFFKVLLISTIKKVDAMVLSMEGRSFGARSTRSFSRKIGYSDWDKFLLFLAFLVIILIIIFGRDLRL